MEDLQVSLEENYKKLLVCCLFKIAICQHNEIPNSANPGSNQFIAQKFCLQKKVKMKHSMPIADNDREAIKMLIDKDLSSESDLD